MSVRHKVSKAFPRMNCCVEIPLLLQMPYQCKEKNDVMDCGFVQ